MRKRSRLRCEDVESFLEMLRRLLYQTSEKGHERQEHAGRRHELENAVNCEALHYTRPHEWACK